MADRVALRQPGGPTITYEQGSSDLIITGGYNVYPKEVELVLDGVAGVAEATVVGLADPDFGEAVTAFVVRAPGSQVTADDLERAVAGRLARFKHPRRYVFVEDLPRHAMGKVQKAVLRQQG